MNDLTYLLYPTNSDRNRNYQDELRKQKKS